MRKKSSESKYFTQREMEKRYFTDTNVSICVTTGAISSIGESGINWMLEQAFMYGLEDDGKRSYFLRFEFTTENDSEVSRVKILDGNLKTLRDNLVVNIPEYRFNGGINIIENWNGRIHTEILDEHYICVYLPGED